MIDTIVLCASIGAGFVLGISLDRLYWRDQLRRTDAIWRARLMAQWPSTARLTIALTDHVDGGRHVEAVELSRN